MDIDKAKQFAVQWVMDWNRHDVAAVLAYYTYDFEMSSPTIHSIMGIPSGTLKGKALMGGYLRTIMNKNPDLKLTLIAVTAGMDTAGIYFNTAEGKKAFGIFFFDDKGMVYKAIETLN